MHHQLVDQWQNRIFVHWPVGTRNTECQSSWQRKPASWVSTGGILLCVHVSFEKCLPTLCASLQAATLFLSFNQIYPVTLWFALVHTCAQIDTLLLHFLCAFFLGGFFYQILKNTIYTTQKNNCIIVMLTFLPMGAVVQPLNQCSRSKWGLISGSHIKSRLLIYCHVRAVCHCIFPFIFNYHKAENKMMKVI